MKKKMKKMFQKNAKKQYEGQVENKLVSKHNKYWTLPYFITNMFCNLLLKENML